MLPTPNLITTWVLVIRLLSMLLGGTTNLGSWHYFHCILATMYPDALTEFSCAVTINLYANGLLQTALLKAYVFTALPVVPQPSQYPSAPFMNHPMQRGGYNQEFDRGKITRYSAFLADQPRRKYKVRNISAIRRLILRFGQNPNPTHPTYSVQQTDMMSTPLETLMDWYGLGIA